MWTRSPFPLTRIATLCLCAAVLPACGGGGDDASDAMAEQPRVALSAANEPRVTAEALDAALESQTSFALDALSSGNAGSTQLKLAALTGRQVAKRALQSAKTTVQASGTQTIACAVSGSVQVSVTVANPSLPLGTAGDNITAAFNACVDAAGLELDGSLSLRVVSSTATLQVWDIQATTLSITVGDILWRASGSTRLTLDGATDGVSKVSLSSARSSRFLSVGGQQRASYTLLNSTLTAEDNSTTGVVASTADFVATGTFKGLGDVSYKLETLASLQGPADAAHPTSGTLRITGAANGSLLLVLGATSVRILADYNGDGSTDSDTTRTWEEIDTLR